MATLRSWHRSPCRRSPRWRRSFPSNSRCLSVNRRSCRRKPVRSTCRRYLAPRRSHERRIRTACRWLSSRSSRTTWRKASSWIRNPVSVSRNARCRCHWRHRRSKGNVRRRSVEVPSGSRTVEMCLRSNRTSRTLRLLTAMASRNPCTVRYVVSCWTLNSRRDNITRERCTRRRWRCSLTAQRRRHLTTVLVQREPAKIR